MLVFDRKERAGCEADKRCRHRFAWRTSARSVDGAEPAGGSGFGILTGGQG